MKTAATLNPNRRKGRNAKNKGERGRRRRERSTQEMVRGYARRLMNERIRLAGHAGDCDQDGRGD
jgi:hypothetical protein